MARPHWNVLVFPGGMENGIEIYNSLKYCKEITLFSASSDTVNHSFYLYKQINICKDVREDGWIDDLNGIIKKNNIDIIFPANSIVIDALNNNRNNIACPILLPKKDVIDITRSKKKTLETLQGTLPIPVVYNSPENITNFPVFAKPNFGYGSQGAQIITNSEELFSIDFSTYIVQEYLPGKEYTIDCFSDNDGTLLFAKGRERSRIRMGTSMHAEDVGDKLNNIFLTYAKAISERIRLTGAWFFQMKEDSNDQLKLLEIDARIAGTMCYRRCYGLNFSLLSIYSFFGHPISILLNEINITLDRCLRNRYSINYDFDKVYIDFDDTVVFNGKVNPLIIAFLFQCLNNGTKLLLLTKHLGSITETLKKYKIDGLFSNIIKIEESEKKYKYIDPCKAIFIDDSFSQRKEVAEKLHIPTFDASMIECLIDERI